MENNIRHKYIAETLGAKMNFKIEAVCFCDVAVCHDGNEKFYRTNNANYSHVHYVVTERTMEFAISLVLVVRLKNIKKDRARFTARQSSSKTNHEVSNKM